MKGHKSGFIAIVGPANAGKSTLLNALLGHKVSIVSPKPQTTRNRVLGIKDGQDYQMIFLDTPGFFDGPGAKKNKALGEYLRRQVKDALEGIDITMLVIDGGRLLREASHLDELVETCQREFRSSPEIVAINKVDTIEKNKLLPLLKSLYEKLTTGELEGKDIELIPISAKNGDGLRQLETVLLKKLPIGVQYFPEGQLTDQSDENLAAEIIREKLFHQLNDELPYSIAVRIERWEDEETVSRISAVISVERESQKPIVIGAKGARLKSIGTAARKELERIFAAKIFLELFVKVEEHWTHTDRGLKKVGLS